MARPRGSRVSERLSLGFGVTWFDVSQRIDQEFYAWDEDTLDSFFAASSYLPERLIFTSNRLAEGGDRGLTAGFLWRWNERWRLGGAWRTGPEVDDAAVLRGGPRVERIFPGNPPGTVFTFTLPLAFPDVVALGAAFRSAGGRFTASCEWDRVEYSDLVDSDPDGDEFIPNGDELSASDVRSTSRFGHL